MEPWSDTNRFNQSGYSAATIFPARENYKDHEIFLEDLAKAELREESHIDWRLEQQEEARMEWLEMQAEIKAERDDY